MFGYVTPKTDELKVKEHIFYKSVYCGLCRTMGRHICSESRITLSYDIVFLALVRFALTEERLDFYKGRCLLSPYKKRAFMKSNRSLEYSASAGALLAYHSIRDNAEDKHGIKKAGSRLALCLSKRMRKKAGLSLLDKEISERLKELSLLEKSSLPSPDACADAFGRLLSFVFGFELEEKKKRIANELGYHIGKWIYLADAVDDYFDDRKNNEFNPLTEINGDILTCSMRLELEYAMNALSLIDFYDEGIKNILENIICLGMTEKSEKLVSAANEKYSLIKGKESQ